MRSYSLSVFGINIDMFLFIYSDTLRGVNNWTWQIFCFCFSARSSLLLLIVWCLALSFQLIVDVLLGLDVASLIGLELNRFEHICTCILNSAVVSLEESLVHELLKWSAVAHLKEVLRKLLSLFISKLSLLVVGWCTFFWLRLLNLGNLGPSTDRILLLSLSLCLCLSALIPSQTVLRLGLSLLLHLISATASLGLGLHLSLSLETTSWPAKGTASLLCLLLSLLLSLHAGHKPWPLLKLNSGGDGCECKCDELFHSATF